MHERWGYFCVDSVDPSDEELVFDRPVTLRDTWARTKNAEKLKSSFIS